MQIINILLPENKKKVIENFNLGIECYLNQEWEKGVTYFENALAIDPEDSPSKVYVERCKEYMVNPPPLEWDGVYVMKTK